MTSSYHQRRLLPDSSLWQRMRASQNAVQFLLELTPRCGLNCRHCYINRPAGDADARARELHCDEIIDLAKQAVDLGAFWCTLTGGDPLLREDFREIYLGLKRLGLLICLFTNGTLITPELARFFRDYPPRDLYLTVYGATQETYEMVTRRPNAYAAFRRGLALLASEGVPVRFKAIALRSNWHELPAIAEFCRTHTTGHSPTVRFGDTLHLRIDGDVARNEEIRAERLTPQEVLSCRQLTDAVPPDRHEEHAVLPDADIDPQRLFRCNAGHRSYTIGYDGYYRLCASLTSPELMYNLRTGTLREAIEEFTPRVRAMRSDASSACAGCALRQACTICPAYAFLETGSLNGSAPYFCAVAEACARHEASTP